MYCGDETGSFIGEIATSSCRFGYGGDDCPKSVLSSYMYQDGTIPTSSNHFRSSNAHDDTDIVPIFQPFPRGNGSSSSSSSSSTDPNDYLQNGIIQNYNAWENAWHEGFHQLNATTLNKHTGGGITIKTPRKHSSGITSSMLQKGKDGRGYDDSAEVGVIMHPILAIDHGNVHTGSLGAASTGPQYQQSIIQKQKSQMMEIIYESLSAPALFLAPAPMLASFANGRQTSLVVDVGAGGTRVTPVVDGLILEQSQRRNGRGGDWLGAVQERVLGGMGVLQGKNRDGDGGGNGDGGGCVGVIPRYLCKSKNIGVKDWEKKRKTLFHQVAVRDCMYEMKTAPHVTGVSLYRNDEWTIPFLNNGNGNGNGDGKEADKGTTDKGEKGSGSGTGNNDMEVDIDIVENSPEMKDDDGMNTSDEEENQDYDSICKKRYELPDGTEVNLVKTKQGQDLCRLNELLFADELPFSENTSTSTSTPNAHAHSTIPTMSNLPIHELIKESLTAVSDSDIRKELCGNIILTGAASLVPNIEKRLSLETQYLVPNAYKCRIIATSNSIERRYAAWIGGSVLSSLGSFQQLWLSRKEYDEYGMTLATQRFP